MQSVWKNFGHMRSWDGMRTYVQLDLGKRPSADGTQPEISIDDARLLTARAHDFPTWDALVELIESRGAEGEAIVARPVVVFAADAKGEGTTSFTHATGVPRLASSASDKPRASTPPVR